MKRRVLIWMGLVPCLVGLVIGVAVTCWSVNKGFRPVLLALPAKIEVPAAGGRVKQWRAAGAHEGWLAIRAFEHYMDSLRQGAAGARQYDSILHARPGIMDSAQEAEVYFYLQDRLKK
jgi:hypothetical protein